MQKSDEMALFPVKTFCRHVGQLHRISSVQTDIIKQTAIRWYSKPPKIPEVKPPGKAKAAIVKGYMRYMVKMEKWLEQKSPKTHKIYMLFKNGVHSFFLDSKAYYKVTTGLWTDAKLTQFTRYELENYRQMPWDLLRAGPIVVLLNIPITDVLTPLFAYLLPRQLLCRHFWTPEQKIEFGQYYLKHRLPHVPKALNYMEKHLKNIKDPGLERVMDNVLLQVEKGEIPETDALIELKALFIDRPFGLDYLTKMHKVHSYHLARCLNLSTFRNRLMQDALLLHNIDLAMHRENLSSLELADAQQACFHRAVDATALDRNTIDEFLGKWLAVSTKIDDASLSLLLHLPIFLSFNHPGNVKLCDNLKPMKRTVFQRAGKGSRQDN